MTDLYWNTKCAAGWNTATDYYTSWYCIINLLASFPCKHLIKACCDLSQWEHSASVSLSGKIKWKGFIHIKTYMVKKCTSTLYRNHSQVVITRSFSTLNYCLERGVRLVCVTYANMAVRGGVCGTFSFDCMCKCLVDSQLSVYHVTWHLG